MKLKVTKNEVSSDIPFKALPKKDKLRVKAWLVRRQREALKAINEMFPKSVALVLLLLTTSAVAAPPFQNVTWAILWDQPTNMPILSAYVPGTNQAYKVYGTTTLGTPQANWPLLTTFTNWALVTNGASIQLSNNVTLPFAQQYFFFVNPTNVWGEPPFSLGFGAVAQSGPVWCPVLDSTLSRQGP
jgi:hypothetical protein